jgi:hypothetical protein
VVRALLGHASLASTSPEHACPRRRQAPSGGGRCRGQAVPVSRRALRTVGPLDGGGGEAFLDERGWLAWLQARLDPGWRAGEWDGER